MLPLLWEAESAPAEWIPAASVKILSLASSPAVYAEIQEVPFSPVVPRWELPLLCSVPSALRLAPGSAPSTFAVRPIKSVTGSAGLADLDIDIALHMCCTMC